MLCWTRKEHLLAAKFALGQYPRVCYQAPVALLVFIELGTLSR